MRGFCSFVGTVSCVFLSFILFGTACSKTYDSDRYVGDYEFSTAGEMNAYEIQTEDGVALPVGNNETFVIQPISGTAKIFRKPGETENFLCIQATYDDGDLVMIDAVVDKADRIQLLPFFRNVILYDESGKNIVYDGRLTFSGEGGIEDGVICVKICPSSFDAGGQRYGCISSGILAVFLK